MQPPNFAKEKTKEISWKLNFVNDEKRQNIDFWDFWFLFEQLCYLFIKNYKNYLFHLSIYHHDHKHSDHITLLTQETYFIEHLWTAFFAFNQVNKYKFSVNYSNTRVWDMFKVNNKDTRTTSMSPFWCL